MSREGENIIDLNLKRLSLVFGRVWVGGNHSPLQRAEAKTKEFFLDALGFLMLVHGVSCSHEEGETVQVI